MLKKIFKYEWKTILPLLLGVHGVGLIVGIFCRIGLNLMGGIDTLDHSIMAALLVMAAIMAIGCVMVYTSIYTGYRFYKSVFTQQGYLTNTLPVTSDQLIWGKGLTALIWIVLDLLWAFATILILVATPRDLAEMARDLPRLFSYLLKPGAPAFGFSWLILLSVVLTPFVMIIQLYVSAAIGNLFTGHKLLATICSYIGINFIQQILGLVMLAFAAPRFASLSHRIEKMENNAYGQYVQISAVDILTPYLVLSLVFSVLCAVGFYILCRYVLDHRLNLE